VGYLLATVPLIAAQLVRMSEGAAAAAFAGTFTMADLLRYVDAKTGGFLNPINEAANLNP